MAVKVAINGFGRIGRLAFRQMFGAEGYEVVAINDLTSPKMLAHLLKYDSSQGTYEKAATVKAGEDSITVDGQEIKIYAFPDANNCPWGEIAYTGDQMTLDGPQRKGDLRRSRAAAINIVPNSTGAAKAIGLVIPELNGKLIGSAQRVPTPTGSTTILTAVVKGADVTVEGINAAMKAAANESFGYNEDEIVSSDIVGMRFGSLFDATQTMVNKVADDLYEVQVVSWYDNENSYTSQMVRTIKYFAELA